MPKSICQGEFIFADDGEFFHRLQQPAICRLAEKFHFDKLLPQTLQTSYGTENSNPGKSEGGSAAE
jgi:hypothetical protein